MGEKQKVLVLLGLINSRGIEGRTRMQKMVFLLQNKYKVPFHYRFIPYYFGPHSKDLQMDVNVMRLARLIEVTPGIQGEVHRLTKPGNELSQRLKKDIDPHELRQMQEAIPHMLDTPLQSLVAEAKTLAASS